MKHRLLMIVIIISVFILGTLVAMLYKKSGNDVSPKKEVAVSEKIADDDSADPEGAEDAEYQGDEDPGEDTSGDDETDEDEGEDDGEDPDEEPAPGEEAADAAEEFTDEDDADSQSPETGDNEPLPTLPKFDELLQVNPYVSGWLNIDGSPINNPVVYTPGSQNYFLHRDIYGGNNSSGTLFIAINWRDGFNNTLIYGHNMKDGSGFGSLAKFADASYGLSHNVIHFDTLYEEREYELLGVFYSQIAEDELETEEDRAEKDNTIEAAAIAKKEAEIAENEGEAGEAGEVHVDPQELTLFDIDLNRDFGDEDIFRAEKDDDGGRFRYYYYTDLADKDDYDYFVRNVKERALYDTGVDAEWGDELITLSTCSYQVQNGRFIVVGVRKK